MKIEDRTYTFSLRIVRLVRSMPKDSASQIVARQVMRSGTSVGANVEEAIGAQTKREFANKMQIAYKEARESRYWLRIIRDMEMVKPELVADILQESLEIVKILAKTVTTARANLRKAKPAA